jgi:hypothetical protein
MNGESTIEARRRRRLAIVADAERCGARVWWASDDDDARLRFVFAHGVARHVYAEEPGEHHALLRCATPAPAFFDPRRGRWTSEDAYLALVLDGADHMLGLRTARWDGDWAVQIRPVDGGSHLAMMKLPELPDEPSSAGFSRFLRVAATIRIMLGGATSGLPHAEPIPSAHGKTALALLRRSGYSETPSSWSRNESSSASSSASFVTGLPAP